MVYRGVYGSTVTRSSRPPLRSVENLMPRGTSRAATLSLSRRGRCSRRYQTERPHARKVWSRQQKAHHQEPRASRPSEFSASATTRNSTRTAHRQILRKQSLPPNKTQKSRVRGRCAMRNVHRPQPIAHPHRRPSAKAIHIGQSLLPGSMQAATVRHILHL